VLDFPTGDDGSVDIEVEEVPAANSVLPIEHSRSRLQKEKQQAFGEEVAGQVKIQAGRGKPGRRAK
jgi:hypothetical protein